MVKRILTVLASLAMLLSCDKLDLVHMVVPVSPDVNSRVEASLQYNADAGVTILYSLSDTYHTYICSDIHVEESPVRFRQMLQDLGKDHIAVCYQMLGDILFGKEHLEDVVSIMQDSSCGKGFAALGNHDIIFNFWGRWQEAFHSSCYYYTVATPLHRDMYIVLDSASGLLGESQKAWLENVLRNKRPSFRNCVVSTHANLLRTDGSQFPSSNYSLDETFYLMDLFRRYNVDMFIAGHDHHRSVNTTGGVTYITLDDIKEKTANASYLILESGDNLSYRFVSLADGQ